MLGVLADIVGITVGVVGVLQFVREYFKSTNEKVEDEEEDDNAE